MERDGYRADCFFLRAMEDNFAFYDITGVPYWLGVVEHNAENHDSLW
jgi:hypothetical protein